MVGKDSNISPFTPEGNLGIVEGAPTVNPDAQEVNLDKATPQDILVAQKALDSIREAEQHIRAKLAQLQPGQIPPAELSNQLSDLSSLASDINSAILSGNGTALQGLVNFAGDKYNSTLASIEEEDFEASKRRDATLFNDTIDASAVSSANYGTSFATQHNLGGINQFNAVAQQQLTTDLNQMLATDKTFANNLAMHDVINKNQTFSGIKADNLAANQQAQQDFTNLNDPAVTAQLNRLNKLHQSYGVKESYGLKDLNQQLQSGEITQAQLADKLKQHVDDIQAKLAQKQQEALNGCCDKVKHGIKDLYRQDNGGQDPTSRELAEYINKQDNTTADFKKQINDAAYVIAKHGEEKGMDMLTPEQSRAWIIQKAKINQEAKVLEHQIEEFKADLTPEQRKEIKEELYKLTEKGSIQDVDQVVTVLESGLVEGATVPENLREVLEKTPPEYRDDLLKTILDGDKAAVNQALTNTLHGFNAIEAAKANAKYYGSENTYENVVFGQVYEGNTGLAYATANDQNAKDFVNLYGVDDIDWGSADISYADDVTIAPTAPSTTSPQVQTASKDTPAKDEASMAAALSNSSFTPSDAITNGGLAVDNSAGKEQLGAISVATTGNGLDPQALAYGRA